MSFFRRNLGNKGERIAEKYLLKAGYKLLKRNLKTRSGEIDLLMKHNDELVIVEVRSVSSMGKYDISDRVPPSKRKQLLKLAREISVFIKGELPPIRFDIVVIEMIQKPVIHHIENAFSPNQI